MVQLQLLTATVKLFLKQPETSQVCVRLCDTAVLSCIILYGIGFDDLVWSVGYHILLHVKNQDFVLFALMHGVHTQLICYSQADIYPPSQLSFSLFHSVLFVHLYISFLFCSCRKWCKECSTWRQRRVIIQTSETGMLMHTYCCLSTMSHLCKLFFSYFLYCIRSSTPYCIIWYYFSQLHQSTFHFHFSLALYSSYTLSLSLSLSQSSYRSITSSHTLSHTLSLAPLSLTFESNQS